MMRGTDEIVAVAEELLSKRFGGTQSLTDIEKLGGSGTAIVLRARVAPSPFLQQRSVVLKYTPATNDSMDDAALIREVVSYQFTTSLPKDVRPGPVLLAYDIDSRLLVISDSGEGETFADLLNYSGPEQRLQLLRNLGQSIGRMHAGTADREQHFDILLTRMLSRYPDTAELHEMRDASLLVSIDNGVELLSNADVQVPHVVRDFATDAQRRLASGQHRAFTPFDLSPDNIIYAERTQFLDYEWAGFRDSTFDVACVGAGFPQCLFPHTITDVEADAFIESWVREVNGIWPNVNNRVRLQARIVTALIGWALASISYLYFGSMNQLVSELGNRPDSDSDIPDAATEALVTANIDPFDDVLSNPSLGSIVGEGSIARQDLLETFEALTRYASRGDDPRFPEVAAFANSVVERLQAMEQ